MVYIFLYEYFLNKNKIQNQNGYTSYNNNYIYLHTFIKKTSYPFDFIAKNKLELIFSNKT